MRQRNPYQVRDHEDLQERVQGSQRVVPHTVRSLAQLAGVSHGTIGDLLTGKKSRVSVALAQRLSAVLGVSMDDLFVPTVSMSRDSDKESAA